MNSTSIPLPNVPIALRDAVRDDWRVPTYRRIYHAAIDGLIRTYQRPNGRREVRSADLPKIIEFFGLDAKA